MLGEMSWPLAVEAGELGLMPQAWLAMPSPPPQEPYSQ